MGCQHPGRSWDPPPPITSHLQATEISPPVGKCMLWRLDSLSLCPTKLPTSPGLHPQSSGSFPAWNSLTASPKSPAGGLATNPKSHWGSLCSGRTALTDTGAHPSRPQSLNGRWGNTQPPNWYPPRTRYGLYIALVTRQGVWGQHGQRGEMKQAFW